MLAGMPGRARFPMSRLPDVPICHAPALCSTTGFDLQRHLQQFFPPFMRVVTRSRLRAGFRIGKTKSKTFAPQSHGAAEKSKFKARTKKIRRAMAARLIKSEAICQPEPE